MQQSAPGVEKDKPILKNGRVGHQYPYHQNPFTSWFKVVVELKK